MHRGLTVLAKVHGKICRIYRSSQTTSVRCGYGVIGDTSTPLPPGVGVEAALGVVGAEL